MYISSKGKFVPPPPYRQNNQYKIKTGVLHRDVRPESILLTKDLRGLIGDFGVAKVVTPSAQDTGSVGTMEYMAPEIIKGEKHTLAVDIYSFGKVLYSAPILGMHQITLFPSRIGNLSCSLGESTKMQAHPFSRYPSL